MPPGGVAGASRVACVPRYFEGSAANFVRQPAEQKKYSWSRYACRCALARGSTVMPQTGSVALRPAPRACVSSWPCASIRPPAFPLELYTPRGYIEPMRTEIKSAALKRLRRIEGQVRGLARMVEEDRYCIDLVTQISAVRVALRRVEEEVLRDHVAHCVEGAIASGNQAEQRRKIAELMEVIERADR